MRGHNSGGDERGDHLPLRGRWSAVWAQELIAALQIQVVLQTLLLGARVLIEIIEHQVGSSARRRLRGNPGSSLGLGLR
jgi:hypothetical protein